MAEFTFLSQAVFTTLYLLAAVLYLKYFFLVDRRSGVHASQALTVALAVHLAVLVFRAWRLGYLPIATVFDALAFAGFVIGVAYLTIEWFSRDRSMGTFITMLIVVGETLSLIRFSPSGPLRPSFKNPWFQVHVSCSMFAFSSFTIAFIGAILYLILYREIHQKRPGRFYSRLTSLVQLDRVNLYGSALGLIFLALAIFTGYQWLRGITAGHPRLDARIVASWFTLAVYLAELLVRQFGWVSGRKLSWLSIAGFVAVIVAFAMEGVIRQ